jgi:DNA-directed RNA polymerase specialized sigma24 family protein
VTDIDYLLTQWARWAYSQPGVRVTYPHKAAFHVAKSGGYAISDEQALLVDRAVGALAKRHPTDYEALTLYYLGGLPYHKVARMMSTPKRRRVTQREASQYVDAGRKWLDGVICGLDKTDGII